MGRKTGMYDFKMVARNLSLKEHRIKSEEELEFSFSSQAGMLMRRFYKKYGLEFDELKKLKNVYLVYIEKEAIVSKITMEQEKILEKISVSMEYK